MRVKGGHIVLTPGQEQPYKVVLDYEWGEHSEHPVATVCAGEALIRARLAPPLKESVEALRQGPRDAMDPGADRPGRAPRKDC